MANRALGLIVHHLRRMSDSPTTEGPTDRELLKRFAAMRDEPSFEALVQRHGRLVWTVCRRQLRSTQDAEDSFQAIFTAVQLAAGALQTMRLAKLKLAVLLAALLAVATGSLLAEEQVAEIIRLLDTGDEYCRREAISRLESMKTPRAAEAIDRHKREFSGFMKKCAAELRAAGLDVAEVTSTSIRLGPEVTWLNMPMFFTRRQSPTFFADFVNRAKELVAMKSKTKQ